MKRLHSNPIRDDLFSLFDKHGDVARTGFLEVGHDDVVRFVDDRTPPIVYPDPAE